MLGLQFNFVIYGTNKSPMVLISLVELSVLRSINTEGAQEQMQSRVNKDDVKIKPSSLSIKGIKYGYVLNSIFNQKSDFHPIHSTQSEAETTSPSDLSACD